MAPQQWIKPQESLLLTAQPPILLQNLNTWPFGYKANSFNHWSYAQADRYCMQWVGAHFQMILFRARSKLSRALRMPEQREDQPGIKYSLSSWLVGSPEEAMSYLIAVGCNRAKRVTRDSSEMRISFRIDRGKRPASMRGMEMRDRRCLIYPLKRKGRSFPLTLRGEEMRRERT